MMLGDCTAKWPPALHRFEHGVRSQEFLRTRGDLHAAERLQNLFGLAICVGRFGITPSAF